MNRSISIALPCMGKEELAALEAPVVSGWLTQGPKVAEFEKLFSKHHRVLHALATTSCTTALHLALSVLGVGEGDEVIVPAFTWVATANAVLYCGARPVFVDVDRRTFNIDATKIERAITDRTRAVIAVHLFGLAADVDRIRSIIPDHIAIIEDAACAAGARYKGRSVGGLGSAACFSFHPRKSITTGEGGMLTTNNPELAEKAEVLRNHGASVSEEQRHLGSRPYLLPDFAEIGFNYRMTDLQGAIGIAQLSKLDRFVEERKMWAQFYDKELSKLDWLSTPATPAGYDHAWQSYVTYVDPVTSPVKRNDLMDKLHKKGVATRPGTHAVPTLGAYVERYGYAADAFPTAHDCQENSMAIPLHNMMNSSDYEYVVEMIFEAAGAK